MMPMQATAGVRLAMLNCTFDLKAIFLTLLFKS